MRELVPAREFVLAHARLATVPEAAPIRLYLSDGDADDAYGLWARTGQDPLPFWAFAWAGGLGLVRYLREHPETVAGRRVLDVACGSGLVAIAAARAGAAHVTANDVDRFALAATALNATANGVTLDIAGGDLLDGDGGDAEVVLAGDVFYDRAFGGRILPFLERSAARGALVLVGDPDRRYVPRDRLREVVTYDVPVTRVIEDGDVKRTTIWRVA
jgi:predicted nicotinamide N-methyase